MSTTLLPRSIQVLLFLILVIASLYYGRPFLVPVAFAGLLSMLFLPISRWLENKGLARGLAALACVLMLVILIGGVISLVVWQVTDLTSDVDNMEQQVKKAIQNFRQFIR